MSTLVKALKPMSEIISATKFGDVISGEYMTTASLFSRLTFMEIMPGFDDKLPWINNLTRILEWIKDTTTNIS